MSDLKVEVLYATTYSFALTITTSSQRAILSNSRLLSFCEEGALKEILSARYADLEDLNKAFVDNRVSVNTTFKEAQFPTFVWQVVDEKVALEVSSVGNETATICFRLLADC